MHKRSAENRACHRIRPKTCCDAKNRQELIPNNAFSTHCRNSPTPVRPLCPRISSVSTTHSAVNHGQLAPHIQSQTTSHYLSMLHRVACRCEHSRQEHSVLFSSTIARKYWEGELLKLFRAREQVSNNYVLQQSSHKAPTSMLYAQNHQSYSSIFSVYIIPSSKPGTASATPSLNSRWMDRVVGDRHAASGIHDITDVKA